MALSRYGIENDLTITPFKTSTNYGLTFFFSSKKHLDKFLNDILPNRDIVNYSLSKRFGIKILMSEFADVKLYAQIEKNGIVKYEGGDFISLEKLKFSGVKKIQKH